MVLEVSLISLIIGIAAALKPAGKYDRQLRLFTSCLMLIGVLAPLLESVRNISPDWDSSIISEENAEELLEAVDEQTLSLAEEELENALRQELAGKAIPCSRITVRMNTGDDMSINISSVTIVSTKPDEAERAVRKALGEDVEIYAGSSY